MRLGFEEEGGEHEEEESPPPKCFRVPVVRSSTTVGLLIRF